MHRTMIYKSEGEVDRKINWFDVTRAELLELARRTVASRSDSTDFDAASMPGQLSYLYGTRYLRMLFVSKGWKVDRTDNIESVVRDDPWTKIIFQNVDQACLAFQSPKAISAKGAASDRAVNAAQTRLFTLTEAPEVVKLDTNTEINRSVWFLCMSFQEDDFSMELSLPTSISDRNFAGFFERIFVLSGGDWTYNFDNSQDDSIDLKPFIQRR